MRTAIIIKGSETNLLNHPKYLQIIRLIQQANSTPPFWHTSMSMSTEFERELIKETALLTVNTIVVTLHSEQYKGQLAGVLARYGYTSITITIEND